MSIFKLPDLGEGLVEVEILEWLVAAGDEVTEDQVVVAVETAKAIVDIPSPESGKISARYGEAGDIVNVGDPLLEFDKTTETVDSSEERADSGTVVGRMPASDAVMPEHPVAVGQSASGIKVTPAVRAMAQRLDVDLGIVTPSGADGMITAEDVQRVAKILSEVGPMERLRGARRSMARTMTLAHAEVVPVTIYDDADIDAWHPDEDVTLRLVRAIVMGCKAEPSLNSWYDSHSIGRRLLKKIDLGIAVDTDQGLFVPVLRDLENQTPKEIRDTLDDLKFKVQARKIPAEALRGYTFTLSNFGTVAGRYANPVVVPPTVAILGAGKIRQEVIAQNGELVIHDILPLSLTFDHRAVTGGEAARFLAAMIADLNKN